MELYKNYWDTNISWIGKIPENWIVRKFGHVSYMKGRIGWQGLKQSEFNNNPDDPFLITGMNFKDGVIRWDDVYHISFERYNEAPEIQLKENDLLITKDGTIGKLLYVDKIPSPNKASLNSHLLVLRPLNDYYDPRFMYYQLAGKHFKFYVDLTKTGTTFFGISQEAMNQCKLVFPPKFEQTQIAKFLDQKTGQIDRLIEQKENLLKLLAEKRTAIITQAVTKGLDPNVETKDSGIDWLGEIPKHWGVKKIKFLTDKVKTGTTPSSNGQDYFTDGEVKWFNPGDFTYDSVELEDSKRKIQFQFFEDSKITIYPKNSVLIVGIGATLGKVGVSNSVSYSNQQINAIFPTEKFSSEYLAYVLSSLVDVIKVYSNSTTLGILNQEKTKNFIIPYPDVNEQKNIVSFIRGIEKNISNVF